ncbi:dihydropteroate synthase [Cytophagaceae bacterium YF14B1]|uniref:dihydropteroate synthase n=1 Tax=Xanthocytophaga flava TaxID=3048013 RepID=A0AAE3UCY8_9BACT|nr:dihydropteroate synthase [Xanthocytophaga flavus]MDJ1485329.1 dihydropteroate synthase [Xanthocytophaga flavus]
MEAKNLLFRTKKTFNLRGRLWTLEQPVVMGIINSTPDSFYANSRMSSTDAALHRAERMLADGATILDIGGYSTRPGAAEVEQQEEADRVAPVIEAIVKHFPEAIVSVDTFRASVAEAAVRAGAVMVNDVSGGADERMFETVSQLDVPYILMHSKGTPQTMTQLTQYTDMLSEMLTFFITRLHMIRKSGIKDVILDVGFGFAKTIEQNYFLLKNLEHFHILELPMLVGISRKSMIYKRLNITPEESLNGTTVLNTLALSKGAQLLRVHDVKEAVDSVKLYNLMASS